MRFLLLHLLTGGLIGLRFRVHILVLLAALVVLEAGWVLVTGGLATAAVWIMAAEISLQSGYIAGVGVRISMEYANRELRYQLVSFASVTPAGRPHRISDEAQGPKSGV